MELSGEAGENRDKQNKVLDTANRLKVPNILRDEATVQEYLRAHVSLEEMQSYMRNALEQLSIPEEDDEFAPPPNVSDQSGQLISLGKRRKNDITSGLSELIGSNYKRTLLFLKLAEKMTEEGLHVTIITPELIETTLDPALDEFGLYIDEGTTDEGEMAGKVERLNNYGQRLFRHQQQYEEVREAESKRAAEEDPNVDSRQKVIIARDRQTGKSVAGVDFTACPKVHQYAETITVLNNLHLTGGRSSPIEQGAYQSTDAIRWSRIHDLLLLARESLEQGVNGNEMKPYKVAVNLNYILDPYKLHVEDKPLDKRIERVNKT